MLCMVCLVESYIDGLFAVCYINCKRYEGGVTVKYLDHQQVLDILPDRKSDSHKGDYGKILLICGSRGYTGAAALAAMGALRCGAGLVFLAVPESIYEIEAVKLLEPIVLPLPDHDGKISTDATKELYRLLHDKDAVLIGPGLGKSEGTLSAVRLVAEHFQGPVVLDADGINVLAKHKDILRGRTNPTVITPHEGEFTRLTGKPITDRVADACALARELSVTVVLKGHETVITDGKTSYINQTGNAGMAVGGSGDILAGMITGLLGQGIVPIEAASCAAWLHGKAGDLCAAELGQYGMLPSDMLTVLPRLMK